MLISPFLFDLNTGTYLHQQMNIWWSDMCGQEKSSTIIWWCRISQWGDS